MMDKDAQAPGKEQLELRNDKEGVGGLRQLRKADSHPESPDKKKPVGTVGHNKTNTSEGGEKGGQKIDANSGWGESTFQKIMGKMEGNLMKKMEEVRTEVADVKNAVGDVRELATRAADTAEQAAKSVEVLREAVTEDVERIETNIENMASASEQTRAQLTALETVVTKLRSGPPNVMGKGILRPEAVLPDTGGGKAGGKGGQTDTEKRSRTVYFANFDENTEGDTIKHFIETWTQDAKEHIEEIYPIGLVGERGAARFKSEAEMWEYLEKNRGRLAFKAGSKDVFANADSLHDPNPARTKAIRKVVRLIIEKEKEKEGAEGAITKKIIVTRYGKGRVLWKYGGNVKHEQVAEWDEAKGVMKLYGRVAEWEGEYKTLMGNE